MGGTLGEWMSEVMEGMVGGGESGSYCRERKHSQYNGLDAVIIMNQLIPPLAVFF